MKKLLLLLLLIVPLWSSAQSVNITNHTVTYDSGFNPTVSLTVKNGTEKNITNIVFQFKYSLPNASPMNIHSLKFIEKNVSFSISSKKEMNQKVSLSAINDYEYKGVRIVRIRYSDGSIEKY